MRKRPPNNLYKHAAFISAAKTKRSYCALFFIVSKNTLKQPIRMVILDDLGGLRISAVGVPASPQTTKNTAQLTRCPMQFFLPPPYVVQ